MARVKAVEFWAGGRAARAVAANKLLHDYRADFRSPEWSVQLPGYDRFLADVQSLSAELGIRPPNVKVLAGYSSLTQSIASVLTEDLLLVKEEAFFEYTPGQLKGIAGHELAHIANGDMDRIPAMLVPDLRAAHHKREYAADALAVAVTGDPESLASVFERSRNPASHSHPSSRDRVRKLRDPQTHTERLKSRGGDGGHERG
ncbi:MAG: hypothetical protein K2X82_09290 [Gemmataceae bacterium]|nr:hypothetical protein [Gemmataceae bacterium]